jgi:GNAT superfamily N-acetyltransferase
MTDSSLRDRFAALPAECIEQQLEIAAGTMRDYAALGEHHYRANRPATVTRVLALRNDQPTVVGRFLAQAGEQRVVGVLVESRPALSCALRDWALGKRYAAIREASARCAVLNGEIRCISRVVVHPQWRGLGLAVRLVKASLAQPQTIFTEALAAMGKVNPFFERAGMIAYHRPAHQFDARLRDALRTTGINATDLAMLDNVQQRIDGLPAGRRRWLLGELRRWHGHTHRDRGDRGVTIMDRLRDAQQKLLCEPVYYLHDNRPGAQEEQDASRDHRT